MPSKRWPSLQRNTLNYKRSSTVLDKVGRVYYVRLRWNQKDSTLCLHVQGNKECDVLIFSVKELGHEVAY